MNETLVLFPGDLRQELLAGLLTAKGCQVLPYSRRLPLSTPSGDPPIYLYPVPMGRSRHLPLLEQLPLGSLVLGGAVSPDLRERCKNLGLRCEDYQSSQTAVLAASRATAQGVVCCICEYTKRLISGQHILILGYGNCGSHTAWMLSSLGAQVTVCVRRKELIPQLELLGYSALTFDQLTQVLGDFDVVVNTVPATVLSSEQLEQIRPQEVILDLASSPGGTDFSYARHHRIQAFSCLGLPGKYCPKTMAEVAFREILSLIQKEDTPVSF